MNNILRFFFNGANVCCGGKASSIKETCVWFQMGESANFLAWGGVYKTGIVVIRASSKYSTSSPVRNMRGLHFLTFF